MRVWLLVMALGCGSGEPRAEVPEPTPIARPTPPDTSTPVPPPPPAVPRLQVRIGETRICVLRDGRVFCRGRHAYFESDDPTDVFRPVAGIDDAVGLDVGPGATCVIRRGGTVWCWGRIGEGERAEPTRIEGVERASSVAVSLREACVLREDGAVGCWGGRGAWAASRLAGQRFPFADLSGGNTHFCARTLDRGVWCWGQLPGAPGARRPYAVAGGEPYLVDGPLRMVALDAGRRYSCALARDGLVGCWGEGAPPGFTVPGGVAIGVGEEHVCVLRESGGVSCVGSGEHGELGSGRAADRDATVEVVAGVSRASALTVGSASACVVAGDEIRCWGLQPDAGAAEPGRTAAYPGYRPVAVPLGGLPGGLPRSERVPRAVDPATLAAPSEPAADVIRIRGRLAEAVALVVGARRANVILVDDPQTAIDATLGPGDARSALEALAQAAGLELRTWGRGASAIHVIGAPARLARADARPARPLPGSRRVDLRFLDASGPNVLGLVREVAQWQIAPGPAGSPAPAMPPGVVSVWAVNVPVGVLGAALLRVADADVVVRGSSLTVTGGAFGSQAAPPRDPECVRRNDRLVRLQCAPSWRMQLAGVAAERGRWLALLRSDGDADVVRVGDYVGRNEVLPERVSDMPVTTEWRVHSITEAEVVITHEAPAGPQRARRLILGEAPVTPESLGPF